MLVYVGVCVHLHVRKILHLPTYYSRRKKPGFESRFSKTAPENISRQNLHGFDRHFCRTEQEDISVFPISKPIMLYQAKPHDVSRENGYEILLDKTKPKPKPKAKAKTIDKMSKA
jgi:hypothetical protein